ncbi:bifunctional phosphoribosyl-AMP cyclohydrolase/phosphoribosyl-ATP diphosphatase HisIE [Enterovibrio paralichthyis]|uniref:bifunctional phosphoribosyl-AMP cyclohydrolase/phosphoribosyl-ATP diphosphatase HisIE n=1 Tax=Enterovibrio paralichthyis TaxID=2853805 RepID=UPI001C49274A|nr:bifunctional phosphoribosyl-AMP cyclohydrolase/phosphoribosyl-ATP diphosphatase HisIE [Enterovibrio paralichthyis]MBV7299515.1 bifunctional phosphoribosyl-AMP cyclohydrolase/phosphoribosyl-ATP diphosphatase HisIE [Enterovibrio paralichthyis]
MSQTLSNAALAESIDWEKVDGLVPAIVQNSQSGQVLMMGYMNQDALAKTLDTEQVTFFSRTKERLWTKGETSGNVLRLKHIAVDCDKDTLLVQADPIGPTCHLGTETCWGDDDANKPSLVFLHQLEQVLASRRGSDPSTSYTASLYAKGTKRISQKVGEEGVEVALAATSGDKEELINESADLMYHLLVLLQDQGFSLEDVANKLKERHK